VVPVGPVATDVEVRVGDGMGVVTMLALEEAINIPD
jgi:hypothetical protein